MPAKPYTIVFDIDKTLGTVCEGLSFSWKATKEEQLLEYIKAYPFLDTFRKHNLMMFVYDSWYFIFPAFIEFIKWLDGCNINFAFFSLGSKSRNTELVEQLLLIAFGRAKAQNLLQTIVIISNDVVAPNTYGKDLHHVYQRSQKQHNIENMVLIDDNLRSIYKNQESSFLHVYTAGFVNYHVVHTNQPTIWFENNKSSCIEVEPSVFSTRQLFYAAGLITKAIESFEKGRAPSFSRALFYHLYLRCNEECLLFYDPRAKISAECVQAKRDYFTNIGLETLKTVNPTLELPTISNIFSRNYRLIEPINSLLVKLAQRRREIQNSPSADQKTLYPKLTSFWRSIGQNKKNNSQIQANRGPSL